MTDPRPLPDRSGAGVPNPAADWRPVEPGTPGNIYFLTDDEREGILWAIGLGLARDDGFPFPRDQNRAILRSARDRLTFPYRAASDEEKR